MAIFKKKFEQKKFRRKCLTRGLNLRRMTCKKKCLNKNKEKVRKSIEFNLSKKQLERDFCSTAQVETKLKVENDLNSKCFKFCHLFEFSRSTFLFKKNFRTIFFDLLKPPQIKLSRILRFIKVKKTYEDRKGSCGQFFTALLGFIYDNEILEKKCISFKSF